MINKEYLKNIADYLSGEMTEAQQKAFKQEASQNPILGDLLLQYEQTLFGLNRKWVGNAWKAAALKWLLFKFALGFIILSGVVAAIAIWHKSFKNNKLSPQNNTAQILTNPKHYETDSLGFFENNTIPKAETTFVCQGSFKNMDAHVPVPNQGNIQSQNITHLPRSVQSDSMLKDDNKLSIAESTLVKYKALKEAHLNVANNTQEFTINTTQDTLIKGAKGSRIAIPSYSFAHKNGNTIVGNITLKLQEFITPQDMFENGIGTNSSADGVLSTGGSCYIMAYHQGEEIKIAAKMHISIEFPSEYNPNMETYYGNNTDTGVIWDLPNKSSAYVVVKQKIDKVHKPFVVINNRKRGMFTDAPSENKSQSFGFNVIALKANNQKDKTMERLIFDSFTYKKAYQYFNKFEQFNKKLAFKMYLDRENQEGDTLRVHYKINSEGQLYEYNMGENRHKKGKRKLKRFVKLQGKEFLFPGWKNGDYTFTMALVPKVILAKSAHCQSRIDTLLKDEFLLNKALAQRKNRINVSRLGLVNCDHRVQRVKTTKMVQFISPQKEGFMYVYCKATNQLFRGGLNNTMYFNSRQNLDIIAIVPKPDGLKMCLIKNVKPRDYISITDDFTAFDEAKIKAILN